MKNLTLAMMIAVITLSSCTTEQPKEMGGLARAAYMSTLYDDDARRLREEAMIGITSIDVMDASGKIRTINVGSHYIHYNIGDSLIMSNTLTVHDDSITTEYEIYGKHLQGLPDNFSNQMVDITYSKVIMLKRANY